MVEYFGLSRSLTPPGIRPSPEKECPISPLPQSFNVAAPAPLTSPTPPLPKGEEGIKKKLSLVFLPSLPRGERGRGSEGAAGAATLKLKATGGIGDRIHGDFEGARGQYNPARFPAHDRSPPPRSSRPRGGPQHAGGS